MFARTMLAFACALNGWALAAEAPPAPFQRDAAVRTLGYDPETIDACKTYARGAVPDVVVPENAMEIFLRTVGEDAAQRAACPKLAKADARQDPSKDAVSASSCLAVANAAGGPITQHISEMMGAAHPDVVAAYTDGVAQVLTTFRDRCTAYKEVWPKVATQALLFENRANNLRLGRVCALWRLSLDKELKAATAAGQSQGRAAGLSYFETRTSAALDGTHHYCAEDSTSGLVDANVGLTKMLLDTMPDR